MCRRLWSRSAGRRSFLLCCCRRLGFAGKIIALSGLIALLVLFLILYIRYDLPQFLHDDEAVFLTGFCLVVGVGLIEGCQLIPRFSQYGVPLGAIGIVITMLLHIRLAFLVCVVLSIFCGVLNNFSLNAMLVAFFSSTAALLASQNIRHRGDIIRAGFHVMWVSALCIYGLGFFHEWPMKLTTLRMAWAG